MFTHLMDPISIDLLSKVQFKYVEAKMNFIHGSFIEWIVIRTSSNVFGIV